MANVIPDPGFEAGTGAWACSRGATIGAVSWERGVVHAGTGAARLTRVHPTDTGTFNLISDRYPAMAGQLWTGSGWVYNGSPTARQMRAALVWEDAAGASTWIFGTPPTAQVGAWYQVTVSGTLPAGAVRVRLSIEGREGWTNGQWWCLDDVRLEPGTELQVASKAADTGYGNFQWSILTEPWADVGTAYVLTTEAGAAPVTGQMSIFGAAFHEAVRRITAGPKTSTVNVTGRGPASATWTMETLAFSRFTLAGRTLTAEGQWCVSGGGPTTATDAAIDWGDGSPVQTGKMTAPTWTTGLLGFTHAYPLAPGAQSYTVKLTSGAQNVSRTVTVPGTGRAVLRAPGGAPGAVVDIQQWPERTHERASSVLPIVGRADPVVLLDTLRLASSSITFLTRDAAEGAALLAVLRSTTPLQLLSPCAGVEDVWLTVLETKPTRLTNDGNDARRLWETSVQEVAAP
ncbi:MULTISPECIES: hypothetical protein [unclassified Streptomyces]|uniref:hypothetical protein n=1 Tax=unclassified Streptomyces TaxID=2593676 RepID=UPI00081F47FB|nr:MULTISPECIES: hypothetical protein [unclassified Streptomyces]MYR93388.1 hypothetical protein [Streptomyces sp. SID4937]SCD51771.1 hypothetical protein GA0115243_102552 [Streptomyces sp. ScaeMP-e83]